MVSIAKAASSSATLTMIAELNAGLLLDIVSLLHSHSATAGLLNARERFDAPKCDEDTRMTMIQGMKNWVQGGSGSSGSSMYWLHGPARVGKSALAQSLALALQEERDQAASFFFSRTAAGRNNGAQLMATLACQLAAHIPDIQPFISESVKKNPFVFESANKVQVQKLIVEPFNNLYQNSTPSHTRRSWIRRLLQKLNRKSGAPQHRSLGEHSRPRLILVDGLDECEDSDVQCDIVECLGLAVRNLNHPFRVVIASRPEAHIVATFKLNKLFASPGGVSVTETNLGEDPDAERSITTYLLKEFAEIRRTHPMRNYLPETWPRPADIDHLVRKSSKTFIYPATVIRYIKLPKNRPEECLERILGMSEIPVTHKPYEILDNLYYHIFDSAPDQNKGSIADIFAVLIAGSALQTPGRLGSCTTPEMIETILDYKPGHVEHVLGDLLCVVSVDDCHSPVTILHASLSDFFIDPRRSLHFHIDMSKAHIMLARSFYRAFIRSMGTDVSQLYSSSRLVSQRLIEC